MVTAAPFKMKLWQAGDNMTDAPRSRQFDDIYFSPDDGLAETRHVFLKNNNLPESWSGKRRFTIAETGFGTGLNFLAAWSLFDATAGGDAVLDYLSFEKFPLSAQDIAASLDRWSAAFGGRLERLMQNYPMRIPGWHRIDFGRVRLTLMFDDVNQALPCVTCPAGVDCWFLDGFAPAKNPRMWTDQVFDQMARLSSNGASVATFTAAGIVRRGLAQAGFAVEKKPGYGRKRDMLTARFMGQNTFSQIAPPRRIAILGAGLAGTACAHVLTARGFSPVIFDTADMIASGASGNRLGMFNPRFSAQRSAEADFYMSAFALASRSIPARRCGSLHLVTDDEKKKRFQACQESWGWPADHMRLIDRNEASAIAGVNIPCESLFLPDAGQAAPHDLCHGWAMGTDIRLSKTPGEKEMNAFDAVIFANGSGVKEFLPWLPVHTVRGQIITASASPASRSLKTGLCYGGYIGTAGEGQHVLGSTFQKWLHDTDIRDEDTRDILEQLENAVPGLGIHEVTGARAALRCAAQDRFPVIGAIPGKPGCYVSAAHGSHGMISSLAGAHLIADLICQSPFSLPLESVNILSPQRFLDRAARRGRSVL